MVGFMDDEFYSLFEDIADSIFITNTENTTTLSTASAARACRHRDDLLGHSRVKPKRIRDRRKKGFIPRVLKRDIRRHYGSMIMNVFNSGNMAFLLSFVRQFAVPNFRVNLRPIHHDSVVHLPSDVVEYSISKFMNGVSFDGEEWFTFYSSLNNLTTPDLVHRMHNARLVTRPRDDRSILILQTESEMSWIFDYDPISLWENIFHFEDESMMLPSSAGLTASSVAPSPSFNQSTTVQQLFQQSMIDSMQPRLRGVVKSPLATTATRSGSLKVADLFHKAVSHNNMRQLSRPQHVRLFSQVILVLDAEKRIESIAFGDGQVPPEVMRTLQKRAGAFQPLSAS